MIAGDRNHHHHHLLLTALQCFLLPADKAPFSDERLELHYSAGDRFRMYEFKVRRCPRGRPHDWTECPFAHPGEKARRRDPRRFRYASAACPEFRKGGACRMGDACELSHGVFECWLHPERYRTQPCKDGTACRRRVCFFAHTVEQLRGAVVSPPTSPSLVRRGMSPVEEVAASLAEMKLDTWWWGGVEGRFGAAREAEEEESGVPDVGWVTELVK